MKKMMNKKGFTIVELVIVIAVIAILAAVLIPTFSNVIDKANQSAALQEAKNAMTSDLLLAEGDYEKIVVAATDSDNVNYMKGKKVLPADTKAGVKYVLEATPNNSIVEGVQSTGTLYEAIEIQGEVLSKVYKYTSSKGVECNYDIDKGEWTFPAA